MRGELEAIRLASSKAEEGAAGGRSAEKGLERGVVGVRTPVVERKLEGGLVVEVHRYQLFPVLY